MPLGGTLRDGCGLIRFPSALNHNSQKVMRRWYMVCNAGHVCIEHYCVCVCVCVCVGMGVCACVRVRVCL